MCGEREKKKKRSFIFFVVLGLRWAKESRKYYGLKYLLLGPLIVIVGEIKENGPRQYSCRVKLVLEFYFWFSKYFRIQNMFRSSLMTFRFNFTGLWSIRLVIFVFLIYRSRNLEKFQIVRKIRITDFRVLQLFPSKRKFRPRNLKS